MPCQPFSICCARRNIRLSGSRSGILSSSISIPKWTATGEWDGFS